MASKTLTQKLESARLLIFNSKDPQVAPLLQQLGIDDDYIGEGIARYNETMGLVDSQRKEYQEQNLTYDKFYLEKDDAEANFSRLLKLVRVLSRKDEDLQNRLQIQSGPIYGLEAWIDNAIAFYNRLLNEPDFLVTLQRFKVTPESLRSDQEAIANLRQLRNEATADKGQAQEATRLRNEKLEELNDYTIELRAIAEIALADRPQLLEKLGITVRS